MSDSEDQVKKEKRERKEEKREKKEKKELKKKEKELKKLAKGDSKKRSLEELEELSIDLNEPAPLSKKQKRLIRQGKLTLEEIEKASALPLPLTEDASKDTDGDDDSKKLGATKEKKDKSEHGVWIGNLSFDTTKEELTRFLVAKTSENAEFSPELSPEELVKIEEKDIVRVNLPKKDNKIKGFAYVDFNSVNHVKTAISLSEQYLNGRNLLIKDAHSYEGRPLKDPILSLSKNPPSRILFVGNLSFDTSKELLEEHFQSCGQIVKVRMATFEDTGKCKGFAFIDFKDEEGPTNALKNKIYKKLINRPLRLEFGEDRSKRNPNRKPRVDLESNDDGAEVQSIPVSNYGRSNMSRDRTPHEQRDRTPHEYRDRELGRENSRDHHAQSKPRQDRKPSRAADADMANNQRLKSSVALANAQRASAAIVKSTGKKITF